VELSQTIVKSIVDARERKALKRALESKENWKAKASERKKRIRLLELRVRDLERSRGQWKEKCLMVKNEPTPGKKDGEKKLSKRQLKKTEKKID